ncbi:MULTISPECIES: hypothetical protein [Bacilli]|uniref:hypothetical protein n=1 Tax=Bacilli TaxID=91061 RepID=UPI001889313E|nr:hypothetical protein [Listeria innocua]MBF2419100.1 hypothetical protein [Listeria innocua]MBF2648504.1 hypothetical protein [Listeria innocua]
MKSQLTEELYQLGFLCGIELEIYILDTGKYTSLIIEGNRKGGDARYSYDFYKQTFYPHYPNKVTIYGEHLPAPLLLKRVKQYLYHRKQYLAEQQTIT